MLKFLFSRLDEPTTPDWQSDTCDWNSVANGSELEHPELWETQWDWYYGKQTGAANGVSTAEVDSLLKTLQNEDEKLRLNASYRLGRVGEAAIPTLNKVLQDASESVRNYVGNALSIIGEPAVPTLIDGLQNTDESIRTTAAYALADIGKPAHEAMSALSHAVKDDSPLVRRHAIEGLGIIGQQNLEETDFSETVDILIDSLNDDHYWVRYNATRTLAKFGAVSEPAIPILTEQLDDENRYVRFNAALALKEIDTPESREVLFNHLFSTRWCALTTRETPF